MTIKAIITMIIILGGIWGGMIAAMAKLQNMTKLKIKEEEN